MVFVVAPGNPWFVRDEIASLAGRFGSTPADLRRDCAREVDTVSLRVPTELYEQYEEAYIKRRTSPAKPFWEVVAERLCSTEEKRSRDGQPYC
jgi:hypothetical protein